MTAKATCHHGTIWYRDCSRCAAEVVADLLEETIHYYNTCGRNWAIYGVPVYDPSGMTPLYEEDESDQE